jgi:cobyrinic acid a,c-diamide synthase
MAGAGLILAAPASGSGKTLVAAGLLRLLRNRGHRIAAAKAGPDYIDPSFHALACGRPSINLDVWAMRPATLSRLVGELEAEAKLVLCEGVMGLFDGAGPDGETGSTAALARLTGWPVVLVVDARGQGASAAALVAGFARHDSEVTVAGVIFNRVAGLRHQALLTAALARHLPEVPLLGAVPNSNAFALPSRHLGLIPAGELSEHETALDRAAEAIGGAVDIERLIALARPARRPRSRPSHSRQGPMLPRLGSHIAVARDDAFVFAYPALLADWRRQGASLSFFAPLADAAPDEAADAVFLPGGYPELHAGRLAAAGRFLVALKAAAGRGAALYGECGGYMVLGETLTDGNGRLHRMAGLLPLSTSFAERRLHLGYRSAELIEQGALGKKGARFRGHEFHYATVMTEGDGAPLFRVADSVGADRGASGRRRGTVAGSFIHLIDREG